MHRAKGDRLVRASGLPVRQCIIGSCAGNHCEKSRDDSVYKPMTTDGDFLLRFLSINKQNKNLLLIFKLNKKKKNMASSLSYGYSFSAFESSGKPSFYA